MANIALYPGGYKPPHIGHYEAAKKALEQADKVIVFVGPKERDGITQDMSIQLWKLYTQNDPIEIRKAGVSPVKDVYDFVELEAQDGDTLSFIKGEKDSEDPRFARVPTYAEKFNKQININFINVEDIKSRTGKEVSGRLMRAYIKSEDKRSFIDGLPLKVDEEAAWNTVTGLEEDFYDPRNKYYDFAKSSEFKAGRTKKDDIPPGYKYRRGGMYSGGGMGYGGMYEEKKPGKTLHVYDFDDTIAHVKANIKTTITSPDGSYYKEILIPSDKFPEEKEELEARLGSLNINYDFKEFEKQISDAIINTGVVNKLKNSLSREGITIDKVTILTARTIGHPVTKFLRDELNLEAYVVPLGMQVQGLVKGIHKATWIENHIKKGYTNIYFVDDSAENRNAVAALENKYDINLDVEDPASVKEMMMGMMTEPEKKKHAKSMKRLSKDLKKINKGDQYVNVPKSAQGTLTRKLYEAEYGGHDILSQYKDQIKDPQEYRDLQLMLSQNKDEEVKKHLKTKGYIKENYPPYKADQVQKVRYQASDTFTNSPKDAKKRGYLEGDTYEKMAAKGKKKGNLKQGTVRKRLKIKDGEKIPLSKINKAISRLKKMKNRSEKNQKYYKALTLAKTLKTTTNVKEAIVGDSIVCDNCSWTWKIVDGGNDLYICHKCDHDNTPLSEGDPKKGTGKKPKGSGRRLYTDENPKDTVKVKFSTRQDIVDTLNKASFKSKPHKRQSQIINLIHQRVRAALSKAKDPAVKKRLNTAFGYIKKRKEASKEKTKRMNKENVLTREWWEKQINEVLSETKANTHLTHLEELILTQGQDGYNQAKNFLFELIKNLKGESNSIKNVSVKWDGAPAVFTGINPENGKFFVGTKSVFNKEPKINYTSQDIDKNHGQAAGLAKKLKLALQYLPSLDIKGILQGDFMFDSDDVKTEDIDGTPHYTFKPNTIRYAIEANSNLGEKILNAKIGIIFHTTYKDLSGGGASFGADVSGLNKSSNVWFDNAYFKDDTGILLNKNEEKFILEKIKEADSINVDYTNLPLKNLNTYINSEIRQGEFLSDPIKSFEKFKNWYQSAVDKSIEKVKRPESKEAKKKIGDKKLKEFESQKQDIINIFKISKLLSEAKSIFITKYDRAVATKHFIDNEDGTLSVTKAEGFVAVDHTENGIKLVDRLEFSKNNFNAGKPGS